VRFPESSPASSRRSTLRIATGRWLSCSQNLGGIRPSRPPRRPQERAQRHHPDAAQRDRERHRISCAHPTQVLYAPQVTIADTCQSLVTRTFAVVARTTGEPRTLIPSIQRAIADVDKTLPTFSVATMGDMSELSMGRLSFVMTIIGVTATVALLPAAIGLYGVLAYIVSLRTREISVRLAMSAMPASVARFVTRQGALLAISGVGVGVVAFLASSRLLQAALVGVGRPDPLTIVVVSRSTAAARFECPNGDRARGDLDSREASGARRCGARACWRVATMSRRVRVNLSRFLDVLDDACAPEAGGFDVTASTTRVRGQRRSGSASRNSQKLQPIDASTVTLVVPGTFSRGAFPAM
jgi:hypothetical protein